MLSTWYMMLCSITVSISAILESLTNNYYFQNISNNTLILPAYWTYISQFIPFPGACSCYYLKKRNVCLFRKFMSQGYVKEALVFLKEKSIEMFPDQFFDVDKYSISAYNTRWYWSKHDRCWRYVSSYSSVNVFFYLSFKCVPLVYRTLFVISPLHGFVLMPPLFCYRANVNFCIFVIRFFDVLCLYVFLFISVDAFDGFYCD